MSQGSGRGTEDRPEYASALQCIAKLHGLRLITCLKCNDLFANIIHGDPRVMELLSYALAYYTQLLAA